MKEQDDEKLRQLFHAIKWDEPSAGFEEKLVRQLQRIAVEQQKHKRRKAAVLTGLAAAFGVAVIIVVPITVLHILDWDISFPQLSAWEFPQWKMELPPVFILTIISAFLLLISDLLIRKRLWEKKHKE
jgi:H+/Cl- antiporter ClcA